MTAGLEIEHVYPTLGKCLVFKPLLVIFFKMHKMTTSTILIHFIILLPNTWASSMMSCQMIDCFRTQGINSLGTHTDTVIDIGRNINIGRSEKFNNCTNKYWPGKASGKNHSWKSQPRKNRNPNNRTAFLTHFPSRAYFGDDITAFFRSIFCRRLLFVPSHRYNVKPLPPHPTTHQTNRGLEYQVIHMVPASCWVSGEQRVKAIR